MSFPISLKGAASIDWSQRDVIYRNERCCLVALGEAGENVSALGGCVLFIWLRF